MSVHLPTVYLLLTLSYQRSAGLSVTKCCSISSKLNQNPISCLESSDPGGEQRNHSNIFNQNKPKIFSISKEDFQEEEVLVDSVGLPNCSYGEIHRVVENMEDEEDQFVLLADERELFLSEEGLTYSQFCLDQFNKQSGGIGTVAVMCIEDPEAVCSTSVCLNSCCPESSVFHPKQEKCIYEDGFDLEPTFYDRRKNRINTVSADDIKVFYREPSCPHLHTYTAEEFYLDAGGHLSIGFQSLPHQQFCIQPIRIENHTQYAAKVCLRSGLDPDSVYSTLSSYVIPTLMIVSEIFLFITFVLHILVPEFRKQIFGWMKMCTVACLFLSYQWFLIITFGGSLLLQQYPVICQLMGFLIQFCFLSSFAWMTTMSVEVWLTFRKLTANNDTDTTQRSQRRRFKLYNLFSFGLPLLVTLVTLCIHLLPVTVQQNIISPDFGEGSCFIDGYFAKILYFHGIIALFLLVNLLLFLLSAYSLLFGLWAPTRDEDGRFLNGQMMWIVFELFLVMGLTWVSEVVTTSLDWVHGTSHYLGVGAVIFDVINSLQGFLIFLVLMCKPRMRSLIKLHLKPALTCLRKGDFDSVDYSQHVKETNISPKTLSTSVLRTDVSVKLAKDNSAFLDDNNTTEQGNYPNIQEKPVNGKSKSAHQPAKRSESNIHSEATVISDNIDADNVEQSKVKDKPVENLKVGESEAAIQAEDKVGEAGDRRAKVGRGGNEGWGSVRNSSSSFIFWNRGSYDLDHWYSAEPDIQTISLSTLARPVNESDC